MLGPPVDEEFPKSGEGNAHKQLLRDGSVAVSHTLAPQGTMLTWHGHAAIEVTMPDRKIL